MALYIATYWPRNMWSVLNIKWVIKNIRVTSKFNTQIIIAGLSGWKGVDSEKWKLFWKVSGNLKKSETQLYTSSWHFLMIYVTYCMRIQFNLISDAMLAIAKLEQPVSILDWEWPKFFFATKINKIDNQLLTPSNQYFLLLMRMWLAMKCFLWEKSLYKSNAAFLFWESV